LTVKSLTAIKALCFFGVFKEEKLSSLKPYSDIFSFGRKRNKTPERHYSWSINASIAKSNKLAFSKL